MGDSIRKKKEYATELSKNATTVKFFLAKNVEAMNKYLSICAAKEGITYSFDNRQILDYQDNFKYQGDLPFSVYFDFETITGSTVIFDANM